MYNNIEIDNAKIKILKYIMYQKRTEYEVRNKFSSVFEEDLLNLVIEYLIEAKYLDDTEYVDRFVQNIMNLKNLSIKEIKYKLIQKGIDKKIIERYFEKNQESLEEYEIKSAQNIKIKKNKTMELDKIKENLYKKGYKYKSVESIENEE